VPRLPEILEALRSSGFGDLSGSRVSTRWSIADPLLNALVVETLPVRGPVRELTVHPLANDRLAIRAKLTRPDFLPPINATLAIERQPDFPHNPTLGLRITGLAGLLALAGPLLSLGSRLPPGLRLDSDLLTVDLRQLLANRREEDLLRLVTRMVVHSEEGRIVIEMDAAVA
jgi:hypothetical protein